ncbi:MAG: hypothetical protein NUW02_01005 [Candidatus Campbellbacteria bacterium]|nr:hypothetical protein [Candidatus Campbellbacteria bacterium]
MKDGLVDVVVGPMNQEQIAEQIAWQLSQRDLSFLRIDIVVQHDGTLRVMVGITLEDYRKGAKIIPPPLDQNELIWYDSDG